MILIIESGATKSDWRVVDESGRLVSRHLYPGMNLSSFGMERIKEVLSEGLAASGLTEVGSLYIYTAGIVTDAVRAELKDFISSKLSFDNFDLQNDLVGAARSIFGRSEGVVAIMGTGSNTCFYDGERVSQKVMSGGFILGDDGGGAALGRMFLTDFIKNLIPRDVASDFASNFDASYQGIVGNVYRSQAPSGYLGSLAPFILSHYDDPYIRRMVDDNFQRFIDRSLKCYDTETYPVGVAGGFGYANREIFSALCSKSRIRLAGFVAEPIEGLIRYHSGKMHCWL